jgi:hypothetical protein
LALPSASVSKNAQAAPSGLFETNVIEKERDPAVEVSKHIEARSIRGGGLPGHKPEPVALVHCWAEDAVGVKIPTTAATRTKVTLRR